MSAIYVLPKYAPMRVHSITIDLPFRAVTSDLRCGVRRLVHVSSLRAYDQHPLEEVLDESRRPADSPCDAPYDRSKAVGEVEVRRGIGRGLDTVVLNPTSVIGPHEGTRSPVGQLFLDLHRRRLPAVIASGKDRVDVCVVGPAMVAAETRARFGENYLVSDHWHTVRELAELSLQATGVAAPPPPVRDVRRPGMGTLPSCSGSVTGTPYALHAGVRPRHG